MRGRERGAVPRRRPRRPRRNHKANFDRLVGGDRSGRSDGSRDRDARGAEQGQARGGRFRRPERARGADVADAGRLGRGARAGDPTAGGWGTRGGNPARGNTRGNKRRRRRRYRRRHLGDRREPPHGGVRPPSHRVHHPAAEAETVSGYTRPASTRHGAHGSPAALPNTPQAARVRHHVPRRVQAIHHRQVRVCTHVQGEDGKTTAEAG